MKGYGTKRTHKTSLESRHPTQPVRRAGDDHSKEGRRAAAKRARQINQEIPMDQIYTTRDELEPIIRVRLADRLAELRTAVLEKMGDIETQEITEGLWGEDAIADWIEDELRDLIR